jgi:transcriptional regulator with XRE-family HTH domain
MEFKPMTFKQVIKEYGASKIARRLGVHRSLISHYVSGRKSLGVVQARRIAKAANLKLSFDGQWRFDKGRHRAGQQG